MEMLKRPRSLRWKRLIRLALATLLIFALTQEPTLAEYFFARGVTRFLTGTIRLITNYIPFSLYELTAILLIVGCTALAVGIIVLFCRRRWARLKVWLYRLALVALCILIAFGLLYAPLYNRRSAISALGLTPAEMTEEKVYAAASYYVEALNETSAKLSRDTEGNVLPPYSFSQIADLLNGEFDALGSDYFADFAVRPKQVALSVPMSYLGITGIYFPFYAEANVNVNIPPSQLPTTMAHEMAHAKGVSQEGEANVVAYVLCMCSEDDYLRYSGLMRAAASLLNALPAEQFESLYAGLSEEVRREYRNESAHYDRYEGVIDRISNFFNDIFLKANGVEGGTRSYSATAGSLVALYEKLTAAENAV